MKQEQLPYSKFKVQNFRGITELQTPQLARVNLITGTNNSGKSSLLEAIRLHQHNAALHIIRDILSEREEYMGQPDLTEDPALSIWEQHPITSLFRKAENNKAEYQPLELSTKGDNPSKDITMKLEWTEYQDLHPAVRAMEEPPLLIPGQHYTEPALVIYSEQGKKAHPLAHLFGPRVSTSYRYAQPLDQEPSCAYVGTHTGVETTFLTPLWDNIVLTDTEDDVVQALRTMDPTIQAAGMIGRDTVKRTRTAMVKVDGRSRPLPIKSLGHGINRLFTITLSLVNAKNGVLLVDEFDNGFHPEVQKEAWNIVFQLAQKHHVQVFATAHHPNTLTHFTAAAEAQNEAAAHISL